MLNLDGGEVETLLPYRSRWILAEPASSPQMLRAYYNLRTRVFVQEQGLFEGHDRDEHDARAVPIVAVATSAGVPDEVVGVVRIYPTSAGVWYGGRLAVEQSYRRSAEVGAALIRAAVGTARGLGARRFYATVQVENRVYFERHHFAYRYAVSVCERPHVFMEAEIGQFSVPRGFAHEEAA